jgi:hypothetical protein
VTGSRIWRPADAFRAMTCGNGPLTSGAGDGNRTAPPAWKAGALTPLTCADVPLSRAGPAFGPASDARRETRVFRRKRKPPTRAFNHADDCPILKVDPNGEVP